LPDSALAVDGGPDDAHDVAHAIVTSKAMSRTAIVISSRV
jgi:hypothetical protein